MVTDSEEFEQFESKMVSSLDDLKTDMRSRFETLEERFSQTHQDLKKLTEVLVDVGRFETWRVEHEKVTQGILDRLVQIESRLHQVAIDEIKTRGKAVTNERIVFTVLSVAMGLIGMLLGKMIG